MAVTITKQPTSQAAFVGDTVNFTVEAAGDGLTYQWQYMNPSNTNGWANSSPDDAKTDTMAIEVATHRNGYNYRCVITDAGGNLVKTIVVTLTVLDVTSANGLVPSETLTAIADAIREKTLTTNRILPADMAAMIEGIEAGGDVKSVNGSVTVSAYSETLDLGSKLPESSNYMFILFPAGSFTTPSWRITVLIVETCISGTINSMDITTPQSGTAGNVTMNRASVTCMADTSEATSISSAAHFMNGKYQWWYVYE